jgi:hypothetical protein
MARGKTRKQHTRPKSRKSSSAQQKALSIPELRKSLDYISEYAKSMVKSGGKSMDALAKEFASEWKKVFGKSLDLAAAKSYLQNMTILSPKKGSRHTRKMKGGAQSTMLTGAPMAEMTRPGTDIPYGNFLEYVNKGFWNPEPAISGSPIRPPPVLPYAGTGSNQVGGGMIGNFVSALTMRPFGAENPPSVGNDAQTAWKGQPLGPGPESYETAYSYKSGAAMPTVASSPVYTRALASDVMTK